MIVYDVLVMEPDYDRWLYGITEEQLAQLRKAGVVLDEMQRSDEEEEA
jgi:hypothetical protein